MAAKTPSIAPSFWMSYNVADGPKHRHGDKWNRCYFSVVVEPPFPESFTGLRIIIVCKDMDILGPNIAVRDWEADMSRGRSTQAIPGIGLASTDLATQRNEAQNDLGETTSSSALTAAFKLERLFGTTSYYLRSLQEEEISPNLGYGYRLVYDRQFLFRAPWASTFRLEFSPTGVIPWGPFSKETLHYIHILPCGERNTRPINLSREIVQRIGSHFFRPSDFHDNMPWKKHLLSFALVQKAWLPAIEAIFQIIGRGDIPDSQIGNPVLLARAIRLRPERGSYLTAFNNSYLDFWAPKIDQTTLLEACKTFLEFSGSSMAALGLDRSVVSAYADILREMPNVKHFQVSSSRSLVQRPRQTKPALHLSDIHNIIRNWRRLLYLTITGWDKLPNADAADSLPNQPPSLHSLYSLFLGFGVICGGELLLFACSTLQELALIRVKGLHNQDVATFLRITAPSLRSLNLYDCQVDMDRPDEPFALETLLPEMKELCAVEIDLWKGFFSAAIISGKRGEEDVQPNEDHSLRLGCQAFALGGLSDAVEITGWGLISIIICSRKSVFDPSGEVERALEVAKKRGIKIFFCDE